MRYLLISLLVSLVSCGPSSPKHVDLEPPAIELNAAIKQLSPTEAAAWLASTPNARIIDLRMDEEIAREGKIAGAVHQDFFQPSSQEALQKLDKQQPLLLYCALGGRAKQAAAELHQQGFKNLAILKDGLNAWLKEGQPVIGGK